ncbi:hypothetical protein BDN71DRAFT_1512407 [Pleurotus eryngii]|uniref:Uncharacterized protein n=1 Tax=Pleurotus eryngii TaxID=5323 RepID=A0A9P5ZJE0_PLEER|nr:hypothetical protein BDN71DRAFT_1512407 [Pleurotus eryngii]
MAPQHSGGGPCDVPNPSFTLRSSAKRPIKLMPQATNVMTVYAAICAIPLSPIDYTQVDLSTVQLPVLGQGQVIWEPDLPTKPYDPSNSPHMLSLHFQNKAEDDLDAIAIPLTDLYEDPFAPHAGVHDYLLSVASRENKKPEDFGLQPQKCSWVPSITSIEAEGDSSAENGKDCNKDDLRKQTSKVQNPELGQLPCSAQEVLDACIDMLGSRWDQANGTARGDGQDIWQLFTSYFHEHVDEMIELANPIIPDGVERSSNTVAGLCYPAFKAKYPNGKYREILIAYEDIRKLTGHSKTMHIQVANWNAHARKLGETGETGHGKAFETLLLLYRSNVNQDKSLSANCELALAEGFITSKLGMPPSELLGHFVAYVQNQLLQTILDERAGQPASKSATTKSARPLTSKATVDIEDPSIISISSGIKPGSKKGHYELVWHLARAQASKAGLIIPKGAFPWMGLSKILVTEGYQLINWPVAVSFPGQEKATCKAVVKGKKQCGVTGLNAEATNSLIANFSPNAKQQIQFVNMLPQQAEAATLGKEPVIITVAPEPGLRQL